MISPGRFSLSLQNEASAADAQTFSPRGLGCPLAAHDGGSPFGKESYSRVLLTLDVHRARFDEQSLGVGEAGC